MTVLVLSEPRIVACTLQCQILWHKRDILKGVWSGAISSNILNISFVTGIAIINGYSGKSRISD